MNWIDLKDQVPERDQKCLVYCYKDNGWHTRGIYIAWYLKNHETDTFFFKIDDKLGDGVNSRSLTYFSHWMPLPEIPINTEAL